MKKLASITTILVVFCFNSYCQADFPESIPHLMQFSLKEQKEFWAVTGYSIARTNYESCVITFENKEIGMFSFIDYTTGWEKVEEVAIVGLNPEIYNRYMEFCMENYTEETSEKNNTKDKFFISPTLDLLITFSIQQREVGETYTIRITPI